VGDAATTNMAPAFAGFQDFRSNVTFVPIQFFTVVLPYSSRGCARLVGYVLRKLLGWVDENGEPTAERVEFTYAQLAAHAGVGRDSVEGSLKEAVKMGFLQCVRRPRPDRPGHAAQQGIYKLRWSQEDSYTDSPIKFPGFFFPPSAVESEASGGYRRPRAKAARKNIPNAFFDHVIPRERLSVIRVVGVLLFYSIQWGPGGERRVPVSYSITELSRLTKLSRNHTHEAVREAIERGYIHQIDRGHFDRQGGFQSRSATYAIRWCSTVQATRPAGKGERQIVDRAEKVNGSKSGNGERHPLEKVHGNRPEKVNDMSIKTEHKTNLTTTGQTEPAGELAVAVGLLTQAGFSRECARRLADKRPLEVIHRQLQWLPLRHTSRNRLGLLRRAIEQDWAKPEGEASPPSLGADLQQALAFATQYYAAYHSYDGQPATKPFPKDLQVASLFVERLLALEPDRTRVPEWGRAFGKLVRAKLRNDPQAKPFLSAMLGLFGNEFLRQRQNEATTVRKQALGRAREAHQEAFAGAYRQYLQQTEIEFQRTSPALYEAFLEHRRELRHTMSGGLFLASAETLARFDSEECRLVTFAEFFHHHPQRPVSDFWAWDTRHNPFRFGSGAAEEARV